MKQKNDEGHKKGKILSDILVLVCVLLLLYPMAAEIISSINSTKLYEAYAETVEGLSGSDYSAMLEAAYAYNASLVGRNNSRFSMTEEEEEVYLSLLSLPDTNVMAWLSIEKLGIEYMPVYHTTQQSVLQVGAGHFEGSSLPVGGESTHTVLSSHAGMAQNALFTNLSSLEIGDTFTIYVLGEELWYQVDRIVKVLPDDVSYLEIEEGEDYCTLITCTPIGLNTHRLLVRGTRIDAPETDDGDGDGKFSLWDWLKKIFGLFPLYEWIMLLIALVLIFAFLVPDLVRYIKRKRKTRRESA